MKGITKNALSTHIESNKTNVSSLYKSSDALQETTLGDDASKERSAVSDYNVSENILNNSISNGDLLHNSKRSVILKEGVEIELDKTILQYANSIKEWLEGCLSYRFIGERIGRQISGNDKMLADPVTSIILSVEAVMFLIENNIPLGCLDSTRLNNLSKDDIVPDLIGDICHNLEISSEERYNVSNECYKLYDNIEIVTI